MATSAARLPPPSSVDRDPTHARFLLGGALLVLYVVWGSTYYAMHVAMTFLPPFLMAGPRFVLAGTLLLGILRLRGTPLPTAKQWVAAGVVGVLLLVCGNGFVALGQQSVDSGVAATVVAAMPLWAALLGALWGDRPTGREILGLLLGFAGVVVLNRGGTLSFRDASGVFLVLAPLTWAFGSLLSRRIPVPPGALGSAAQMIVGGLVMIVIALVRGERPVGPPTAANIFALLYLVLFGSLLAFTAYGYLLRRTRPAIATSYAYVNPIVALAIGTVLGGERFTASKAAACGLTVLGVVIVIAMRARVPRRIDAGRELCYPTKP
jgi:drug/metabolite transporter (DMT)-like permease